MFLPWAILLSLILSHIVSANPLGSFVDRSVARPPSTISNVTLPEFDIHCDAQYGENINVRDCEQAIKQMNPTDEEFEFWNLNRDDPDIPKKAKPLPFRFMGDKGECYFQPVVRPFRATGKISMAEIQRTAAELSRKCAFFKSKGGKATNIGGDGNVELIVGSYQPSVKCSTPLPLWRSCGAVISGMEADPQERVFGEASSPHTQVSLPQEVHANDGTCKLRVFSQHDIEISSWYEIWEATVAVYFMCARKGLGGYAAGIGENHRMFASIAGKRPEMLSNAANTSLTIVADNRTSFNDSMLLASS